jgi:hypothetical protein
VGVPWRLGVHPLRDRKRAEHGSQLRSLTGLLPRSIVQRTCT